MTDSDHQRVEEIERDIDQLYLNLPLFKRGNRSVAAWHVMLLHEEWVRLPILSRSQKETPERLYLRMEHAKGALQWALQWIGELPDGHFREPSSVSQADYGEALELMDLAKAYYDIIAPFTLYRRNDATVEVLDEKTIRFRRDNRECLFDVLDNRSLLTPNPVEERYEAMKEVFKGEFLEIMKSATKVRTEQVSYRATHRVLKPITQYIAETHAISTHVTESWSLDGFAAANARKVFAAVRAVCMAHILAIRSAVDRFSIKGAALPSTLLTYPREDWIAILSKNAEVSSDEVSRMLDLCTYDWSMKKRDISLQPFVQIWPGKLTLCPYMMNGSDLERNFRTLMARTKKELYDNTSEVFEDRMTERCATLAAKHGLRFESGVRIPGRPDLPDIDAAFISEAESCLLFCQMKAVIPPSEPTEIKERAKREKEALDQAAIIKQFDTENPGVLARACFPAMAAPQSEFHVVLMQGFHGSAQCLDQNIPVMELTVFESEIERLRSLKATAEWFFAWNHLPKEGIHFRSKEHEIKIGDYRIIWSAFSLSAALEGENR